jgi:hypothetical protein
MMTFELKCETLSSFVAAPSSHDRAAVVTTAKRWSSSGGTTMCSTTFPRLILGGALAFFAASLAAAPAVLLEKARIVPSDGAPEGGFGRAIAISGNVAVVTANLQSSILGSGPERPGAAYVFERDSSGTWRQTAKLTSAREGDLYGSGVAVDGNVIAVAAVRSGLTHVYENQGASWQPVAVLGGTSTGGNGYSIAIENNLLAISNLFSHGMAIYRRESSGWVQIAHYINGHALPDDDYLGPAVDISPNFAIHGSWGSDHFEPSIPSTAFIYTPGAGGNWAQPSVTQITRPGGDLNPDGFSSSVSITASTALISGYVFSRNSAGQWINLGDIATAVALDDDDVTVLGRPAPYRYVTLSRRTSTSAWPWPVRAELATSDGSQITGMSTNNGRALLASYRNNVAYVYEPPTNLDRASLSQDDFQDGDASGWSTTPGSLFGVASSGTFRFYRQSSVAGNSAALWQNTIGNDQAIQADITPRAFDGADRWFGLATRYTDINNYYYVTARSGGGIQLKRIRAGVFTTLGSAALPVAIGTTHRIRLESVSDHVRVLVNDKPVIGVRDSALSGGRPGLMTYKTRADFDNVIVNANPGYVAFTDDFELLTFNWTTVGDWSRHAINGGWILRHTDVTGGGRLLVGNAGHSSFGTQGDQIVQADLRPTQFSGADRWVGLVARYRNEGNYHYVTLRSSGALDIRKLVNGSIQTLVSVPFTVQTNVAYRVRLEAIGTRLRAYVNGTLRAEATDSTLTRAVSSAGVATYKAAVDLDNFSVTQP